MTDQWSAQRDQRARASLRGVVRFTQGNHGSLLDPSAFERKYYARGVGKFLETKPEEGAFVPLVGCNVDPRCDALPIAGDE